MPRYETTCAAACQVHYPMSVRQQYHDGDYRSESRARIKTKQFRRSPITDAVSGEVNNSDL